jgi:pimeloyl-ACP methyl ester carboxylesterase
VPAIGGNVLDWLTFHRELATDVRVCVYDRAGFGWSDPPPRGRRTFDDMADELGFIRFLGGGTGGGPPLAARVGGHGQAITSGWRPASGAVIDGEVMMQPTPSPEWR